MRLRGTYRDLADHIMFTGEQYDGVYNTCIRWNENVLDDDYSTQSHHIYGAFEKDNPDDNRVSEFVFINEERDCRLTYVSLFCLDGKPVLIYSVGGRSCTDSVNSVILNKRLYIEMCVHVRSLFFITPEVDDDSVIDLDDPVGFIVYGSCLPWGWIEEDKQPTMWKQKFTYEIVDHKGNTDYSKWTLYWYDFENYEIERDKFLQKNQEILEQFGCTILRIVPDKADLVEF